MGHTLFSVDVGGTFTDVVMVRDGEIQVTKVPSDAAATHLPVIEEPGRFDAVMRDFLRSHDNG